MSAAAKKHIRVSKPRVCSSCSESGIILAWSELTGSVEGKWCACRRGKDLEYAVKQICKQNPISTRSRFRLYWLRRRDHTESLTRSGL